MMSTLKQRRQAASIRNVAVIAHVDHGKTTLSDHLLSKAQVLNSQKAGTALALDTDAEEQERGITIRSTGISLSYPSWQARLGDPAKTEETGQEIEVVTVVYVGDLPYVREGSDFSTAEAVLAALQGKLQSSARDSFEVDLNAKRGFAMVTFESSEDVQRVFSSAGTTPIMLGGRTLTLAPANSGTIQHLIKLAETLKLPAPEYTVEQADAGFSAKVVVGEQAFETSGHGTQRHARQAAAQEAFMALRPTSLLETEPLRVNLIDCPGHVDFSGEVTAALRICDGALVVVDCIEGVGVQTKTVLRQALADGVQPVLVMNKVDRCMGELQYSPADAYLKFESTIAAVNALIEQYQPAGVDFLVDPRNGSVGFASGLHGWGFTLPQLAERMLQRQGQGTPSQADVLKLSKRLWGSYYVDAATNKWKKDFITNADGEAQERVFCKFALQPIYDVFEAEKEGDVETLLALASQRDVVLKQAETQDKTPKELRKLVLRRWLPVADAMLYMINERLPSPLEAQRLRMRHVYLGDATDQGGQALASCRAEDAPLLVYISKMVPNPGKNAKGSIAFGRIFSGTLKAGDKITVLSNESTPDEPKVEATAVIKSVVKVNATKLDTVAIACAGDVIGLTGLDGALIKCGTLTDSPDAVFAIKSMHFSVSPVVRVAVRTAKASDSSKLQQAMRQLQQQDPIVQCHFDKATGESIIAGVGELHVEVSVNTLAAIAGCEVVSEKPVVSYSETVTGTSEESLAKSSNKHNRLFVEASPAPPGLVQALEKGDIDMTQPAVTRTQALVELTGWDRTLARKVLAIEGSNILMDGAVGVDLGAAKDMIIMGFKQVCLEGPVCSETLQGVVFKITNAKLHLDSAHRRIDQILPMARSVFKGSVLAAQPALLEPIFQVDIQVPASGLTATRKVLKQRRGQIKEDNTNFDTGLHSVVAWLPVAESFGFSGDLVGATSGQAFPASTFSHWEVLGGSVLDPTADVANLARSVRTRKRLKEAVPTSADYLDRL